MNRRALAVLPLVALLVAGVAAARPAPARAGDDPAPAAPAAPATPAGPQAAPPSEADRAAAEKVHQYARLSARLVRGAQPEGDAAFAALAAAGVTSIISVDGARPDVETARKHGIRSVHIPFGYDGIPPDRVLELVKTFQILSAQGGSVFVHCHHGKHRGPAACAIGRMALDGVPNAEAEADLVRAGTDPKYQGLWGVVRGFRMPTAEQLAAVDAKLPAVAAVGGPTQAMVRIDGVWSRLKEVKAAAWGVPPEHPDVEPAHEAKILAQAFREFAALPEAKAAGPAYAQHLAISEKAAWDLSRALERGRVSAADAKAAFDRIGASCTACHAQFRDNTPRR
jgi:protein tyrosine phosphatase (PTP) superfamily phosphohydrolase (DUF442 family)